MILTTCPPLQSWKRSPPTLSWQLTWPKLPWKISRPPTVQLEELVKASTENWKDSRNLSLSTELCQSRELPKLLLEMLGPSYKGHVQLTCQNCRRTCTTMRIHWFQNLKNQFKQEVLLIRRLPKMPSWSQSNLVLRMISKSLRLTWRMRLQTHPCPRPSTWSTCPSMGPWRTPLRPSYKPSTKKSFIMILTGVRSWLMRCLSFKGNQRRDWQRSWPRYMRSIKLSCHLLPQHHQHPSLFKETSTSTPETRRMLIWEELVKNLLTTSTDYRIFPRSMDNPLSFPNGWMSGWQLFNLVMMMCG